MHTVTQNAFVCISIKITPTKSSHVNANLRICIDGDFKYGVCSLALDKWFEKLKSPTKTFGFSGVNISIIVMYYCGGWNDGFFLCFSIFLSLWVCFDLSILQFADSFFYLFLDVFWHSIVCHVFYIELDMVDKHGKLDNEIHSHFSLMQLTTAATK